MNPSPLSHAIVNAGDGAWAFDEHAQNLSRLLDTPLASGADLVYLLGWDKPTPPDCHALFISWDSIQLASDKRHLAENFARHGVPTPRTYVLDSETELRNFLDRESRVEWILKWPIGSGGSGHRLLDEGTPQSFFIPHDWPQPFLVQEFIRLEQPEVFRLYAVGGETFGWNARRFPPGIEASPFVAHALGARYEDAGDVPPEAEEAARMALASIGLLHSFGCADLMCDEHGHWKVLEVNTDGVWHHVDREVAIPGLRQETDARLSAAWRRWVEQMEHPQHAHDHPHL